MIRPYRLRPVMATTITAEPDRFNPNRVTGFFWVESGIGCNRAVWTTHYLISAGLFKRRCASQKAGKLDLAAMTRLRAASILA